MKKLMGEQLNHREIDEILRDVDLNGDGLVDFEGQKGIVLYCFLNFQLILACGKSLYSLYLC